MVEKVRKQIGDSKTLQVDLELFSDAEHPCSMIWGNLTLTLNCESVWYTETEHGDEAPVSWAWIDLLEFLGVCRWEEREKRVDELFWELRTGMSQEQSCS